MGKHTGKSKKRYVDCVKDRLKLACPINGLENSSDEWKVINGFDMKYVRGRYFKERRKNPTPNEKVGNKQ